VRVLAREAAWPKPSWPTLVRGATAEASRVGACLLVFDTFAGLAGLGGDAEKDAGHVQAAMAPLIEAARADVAVLLVHHQRKSGGEGGDAIRGSSALAGAADVLVEYERPAGEAPPRQRQLVGLGRWPQTPVLVLLDVDGDGAWRVFGEGADRHEAAQLTWREALLRALPTTEPGATLDDIEEVVGVQRRKWHAELKTLLEHGLVLRSGAGKRGDPFRHWHPSSEAVQGLRTVASTETIKGGVEQIPSVPSLPEGEGDGISSEEESFETVAYGFEDQDALIDRSGAEFDAEELTSGPEDGDGVADEEAT